MSDTGLEALKQIRALLDDPASHHLTPGEKQAAVLVLFHPGSAGPEVLLTRRCTYLSSHAGQVAFPGGRIDPGDADVVVAALREAEEEVALPPDSVEILGCLPVQRVTTGYRITPVVACTTALPPLEPQPEEVEAIFSVPLTFLLHPCRFRFGTRVINNIKKEFYYFDFKEYYVWGATAKILRSLAPLLAPYADASRR